MKKIFGVFVIIMILLVGLSVFTGSASFSDDFNNFITDVATIKGINETEIKSIERVDFSNLPKEINIKNIDTTNLGLYQINFGDGKPIYVLSLSEQVYESTLPEPAPISYKRMFLNFGYNGEMEEAQFLETATEVKGSLEKGYVMIRSGSITGLSTNLEIVETKKNEIVEILIYKNGELIGFSNLISGSSKGVKVDYDVVSEGTITFKAGDIISVYVDAGKDVSWKDVTTLLEITIED